VRERWISEADTAWNLDTPALWTDGVMSRVLVTAKESHDLRIFDGVDGRLIAAWGREGERAGEYRRPNSVVVVGDFALVVERDNRRVQVLEMPEGTPLGSFGRGVLEYPYGAAVTGTPEALTLWVTDDYGGDDRNLVDPTRRLHRFDIVLHSGAAPVVREHAAFGEATGIGSLRVVESIQADPDAGTLFVADESTKSYLEYGSDGRFRGRLLAEGRVRGDPEGLAFVRCGVDRGYWIATDQRDEVSLFHVFRRGDLGYIGTFRGISTANTDGITFEPGPVPGFAAGVLYAVHDDQALSAIDWGEASRALGLTDECAHHSR
jgi:3-phytase